MADNSDIPNTPNRTTRKPSNPLCSTAPRPKPVLANPVLNEPHRAAAILLGRTKWVNHTVLHYCFFKGTSHYAVPEVQAQAIREAFATWKAVGIGLEFKEVSALSEAEIRIGYSTADRRSASSVGRDILNIPLNQPTTVYGWDLTSAYGRGTALHELGHVLGMEHEHQNPFAGIKWHEEAVYTSLGGTPNKWSREDTFHNILEKLDPREVRGSTWDPDSIMEYEFEPGLIDEPEQYDQNGLYPPGKLSNADKEWVRKWYPSATVAAALVPFESKAVELAAGQQADFVFQPEQSRNYVISTTGSRDAVLALFEDIDGTARYVAADDDSGEERNASLRQKLFKGRTYHVRVRVYHPGESGIAAVIVS